MNRATHEGGNVANANLDTLGSRAADAAMRSAIEALVPTGARPTWTDAQVDGLLAAIRSELSVSLDGALADARQAFECGMGGFATATFMASMRLAGIRAAKSWQATCLVRS